MNSDVKEFFGFLSDARLDVRNMAVKYAAGLTGSPDMLPLFKDNDFKPVKDLMKLTTDEPLTAHDAISALVNLSKDPAIVEVMSDDAFLTQMIVHIILPKNINADLCCMLLNNISKYEMVAKKLLVAVSTGSTKDSESLPSDSTIMRTHRIDNLLEIFVRGETSTYNPEASFHFLGGVFANITTTPHGCQFLLSRSTIDQTLRMSKLVVFTEHKDVIRRGSVVSAIKNCCFGASVAQHGEDVLFSDELNLLVYILLPLSGPEDYTTEEMEGMPDELQLLEPEKKREPDSKIRLMLVEIILLLTSTRFGRDRMRALQVYQVIKKLHLIERDEAIQSVIEEIVNMLMRDEASQEVAHIEPAH
ncbi:Protein hgh1 [Batrachochytrium dendrobatidis]